MNIRGDSFNLSVGGYQPLDQVDHTMHDGMLVGSLGKDINNPPTTKVITEDPVPAKNPLHSVKVSGGSGKGVSKMPKKQLSKAEKKQAKAEKKQAKALAKAEKKKIRAEAKNLRKKAKLNKDLIKVLSKEVRSGKMGKTHEISAVKRMEKYHKIRSLTKEMNNLRVKAQELEEEGATKIRAQKIRAKRKVKAGWNAAKNLGGQGRAEGLSQNSGFNPMTYLTLAKDAVGLGTSGNTLISNAQMRKGLCEIAKQAENRIRDIDQRLETETDPGIREKLETEKQQLEASLPDVEAEIEKIPVGENFKEVVWSGFSTAASTTKVVFSVSSLLTVLGVSSPVLDVVAPVAGLVTVPLSVVMSGLGIATSIKNIKNASKDVSYAKGLQNGQLDQGIEMAEDLSEILAMPEMQPGGKLQWFGEEIKADQAEIQKNRREIKQINQQLLKGELSPDQISELKERKESLQNNSSDRIDEHISRLENFASKPMIGSDYPGVKTALSHLKARQTVIRSAGTLNETVSPYIRQKLKAKTRQEYCHIIADSLAVAGSVTAATGLITSVAGGAGAPLLLVGGAMGLASIGVRYGGGFLARKITKMQQGDSRIKTAQFDEAMMKTLEEEVNQWDNLEAAGMTQNTTAHHMFQVLKKHYPSMPKEWGPKEWAAAIVHDSAKGKERKHYKEAVSNMRHHDSLAFVRPLFQSHVNRFVNRFSGGNRKKAA